MKNKKIIKFGLLGLGTIVKLRIVKLFKKELKNSKVTAVFDKDLKKTNDYCKKFNCKINKSEKNFFLEILIFVIFQHRLEVISRIFSNVLDTEKV